ncbi:GNAT family N-acetyltransferase [Amycolatopsis jiangsuensis]|uniref:RimJ/RimL family protein N-acetyltransferase n=1 Tax=Amycolatopsis jiangsuensis TaxID=1181879 RepID=A0A840J608_9PSEU|nr:GNAT family N-acetyltransferase [Amycolatopsis jiangsuensis]MBB4688847.1 RimJ/RimL family protein N-acetyltransferase [Amycolatopsis jiangsuensis]
MLNEIETERLVLRPFVETDRAAILALHADPRAKRSDPDSPDAAVLPGLFDGWLAHWAEHGYGYCAVRERGHAEVIGLAGVRTRNHRGETVLNLAYRLSPAYWGQGYAVEAARAVVGWAEREVPSIPVLISVNVANTPSLRVVQKLGFTRYAEEICGGTPSRHFRR